MMMTSLGGDFCSVFGLATGLMMMALPIIVVAAILYLIIARTQKSTQ